MIELVGSDRVVIGTDSYARMDVEQPNALIEGLRLPEAISSACCEAMRGGCSDSSSAARRSLRALDRGQAP